MSNILKQAKLFFEACETGKGWLRVKRIVTLGRRSWRKPARYLA